MLHNDDTIPPPQAASGFVDRRRKTDGVNITIEDVWALLKDVNDRLQLMEHRYVSVSTAFVRNDLDRPDYEGHRKAHIEMMKTAELLGSYKADATKRIINGVITFLLGLVTMGFFEWVKRGGA